MKSVLLLLAIVFNQCTESVWREEKLGAPVVSFELYFESDCPYCQLFIADQLYPTFTKVGSIMNLTLVPFGNAETCAIHVMKGDYTRIMPFINCIESSQNYPMKAVKVCAGQHGAPLGEIMQCYNSTEGNLLEHQMAQRTDALKPSHQYVPWVVLNGVHTEKINTEALENLLNLICDTYTGPKPEACSKPETKKVCERP
ncbi:hypothetical protein ACOMHN_015927 [Nucella lapillus]